MVARATRCDNCRLRKIKVGKFFSLYTHTVAAKELLNNKNISATHNGLPVVDAGSPTSIARGRQGDLSLYSNI